jgi:HEAT repeat protein
MESLGSLSDRAARHALLYIIEARDPEVRRQRLEVLNTALTTEAFLERSEQQYDSNP